MKTWLAVIVCISQVCLIDGMLCQIIYRDVFCDMNKYFLAVCGMHSPGLLPFRENVKLFFFMKIWSKVGVRLIHECSLCTYEYGKGHENQENDHQPNKLMIVRHILPVSTSKYMYRTVWRICILMLGRKESRILSLSYVI